MATTLYLTSNPASTHRGTNTAKLNGSTSGWLAQALDTLRGGSNTASQATGTVTGATNGVEILSSATGTPPLEWLSEPVSADVTISGTITANIWAAESSMNANVAINVIIDILRANSTGADGSNTIVNIVKSTNTTELGTSQSANNFTSGMTSGAYSSQTLNKGDRLRIRVFGDDAGTMASGFTFTLNYSGPTGAAAGDTFVTFNETFTFSPANVPEGFTSSNGTEAWTTGAEQKLAMSFVAPGTGTGYIESLAIYFGTPSGTPTGAMRFDIQTDSSGSPSGTSVCNGPIVFGSGALSGSQNLGVNFATNSQQLTGGTTYWIVVFPDTVDSTNFNVWNKDVTLPYANGTGKRYNGTTWSALSTAADLCFTIYMVGSRLWLRDTASDVSTASVDREMWTVQGSTASVTDVVNTATGFTSPIQLTDTAGGTVVDWFTRKLEAFTLTGTASVSLRMLESNAAANASARAEIARVDSDGTNATVWSTWNTTSAVSGSRGEISTTNSVRSFTLSGDDLAVSQGQRLRFRLYIDDLSADALVTGHTVTLGYDDGTLTDGDSYVVLPIGAVVTEFVTTVRYPAINHQNPGIV